MNNIKSMLEDHWKYVEGWAGGSKAIFTKISLKGSDFSKIDTSKITSMIATAKKPRNPDTELPRPVNKNPLQVKDIFNGLTFRCADLSQCNLKGFNFVGCRFERVNFTNADLFNVNLKNSLFINCTLDGVNLQIDDKFEGEYLDNVKFVECCLSKVKYGKK